MEAPFPSYSPPSQVLIILSERSEKKKSRTEVNKEKRLRAPMRAEEENWRHTQALKGPVYCLSSLPWSPHRARRKKKSDRYQQRKKVGREKGPL
jgi:hypothetical protein